MLYELIPNLKENPFFRGVSDEYIRSCFSNGKFSVKEFSKNELAYSSSDNAPTVAIIADGSAKVYSECENENALLKTLYSGDVFGIANLYAEDEPFPSRIIASSKTKILFIDGEDFKTFIENDKTALKNYLSFQAKKIVYLNRKISTLTAGNAEKKLLHFIIDHSHDNIFVSPCSMSELADMLQLGRASLYRAIDCLVENGIIEKISKNTFTIK